LRNFTAFSDAELEFVPGVNAFVGENGSGKTHVMKALYASQLMNARPDVYSIVDTLVELFQTTSVFELIRMGIGAPVVADITGQYGAHLWAYSLQLGMETSAATHTAIPDKPQRPAFIPAIDMMGHTRGFTEAYDEVRLDFELTCRDIVNLLRLVRRNGSHSEASKDPLLAVLGGEIERDDEGRFYLATRQGRLSMPLVAEGLRKIATLVQLRRNGWLAPGGTLFWDEPEVNLNPILMEEVVGAILALARDGVQVFLATHSYVILKELDLQTGRDDSVRYFAFQRSDEGTTVNATDDFSQLSPNPILEQYESLYDRELTRSTGRNRQGERVDRERN
jgi:hypothetical protein